MADKTFSQFLAELAELTALDSADYFLAYDSQTATARKAKASALPTAGGGTVPVTALAPTSGAQALGFPPSGDICYDVTLTASCTFTLAGGTAGQYQTMTVFVRGAQAYGFPATVKWQGGVPPVPNSIAGKVDRVVLSTLGGPDVFGSY